MKIDQNQSDIDWNKEQLELAHNDVQLIRQTLEGEAYSDFYEARIEIECELHDLIGLGTKDDRSYSKLLKQYYAADTYLDKALTAYTYLKQQIEKEVEKL